MPIFEDLYGRLLDHELRSSDATVLFTSTRRQQAVNDGIAEFASLTECIVNVSSVVCSCNTQTYDLLSSAVFGSTDFVRLAARGLEFHLRSSNGELTQLAGDDFPRRDIEWLNQYEPGWRQSTTPSMPTSYYVNQTNSRYQIGLNVPPDIGSSETAVLLVPYVARPAPLASSGNAPFGSARVDLVPFYMAPVHYAAHQLEKLRGDDQASDRQYQKFMGMVTRYTGQAKQKGTNFIRLARNYLRDAQRRPRGDDAGRDTYWRWP